MCQNSHAPLVELVGVPRTMSGRPPFMELSAAAENFPTARSLLGPQPRRLRCASHPTAQVAQTVFEAMANARSAHARSGATRNWDEWWHGRGVESRGRKEFRVLNWSEFRGDGLIFADRGSGCRGGLTAAAEKRGVSRLSCSMDRRPVFGKVPVAVWRDSIRPKRLTDLDPAASGRRD